MNNFIENGKVLELPIDNVKSGDPVIYGKIIGVAIADSAMRSDGSYRTQVQTYGVFELEVTPTADVAPGEDVFIQDADVAATGTITIDDNSLLEDDIISVNGTDFTAGDDFAVGADENESAVNLADAINNSASLAGEVTATVAANVVTITAYIPGENGNDITLAYSDVGSGVSSTLSGSTLAGGSDADASLSDNNAHVRFGQTLYALKAGETKKTRVFIGAA